MDGSQLTLRAAPAANRLEDFVRQEEARGVELGSGSDFERALARCSWCNAAYAKTQYRH
jgi:hypothetical protein